MRQLRRTERGKVPTTEGKRSQSRRETVVGYGFLLPWMLGFLGLTVGPMIFSLYLAFTKYNLFTAPEWVGLDNFVRMFTEDPQFMQSVQITLVYVLVGTPIKLAAALAVAMLLNYRNKGSGFFRSSFYAPSLIGASVSVAIVWRAMFSTDGPVDSSLSLFGIELGGWVGNVDLVIPMMILLAVWQFGAPMVIFLAGLKQIPQELYEAAEVDGAGPVRKFRSVTIPMLSSVIFFNLLLETINAFQVFASAFIISNGSGGPAGMTNFYTVYLYKRGFADGQMGYAAAMAWVLVIVVAIIAFILFKTQKSWVHYAGENR
ncbi:carbohydrate ABC transporter permease [Agromyces albus]|uniref:carbohydrate ABC transporter permease n=1 Tax=Agromyces albus TaxID=205332 RepID=UPI0027D7B479|nr:sugar ABC transporter permease [Agromyces albus]